MKLNRSALVGGLVVACIAVFFALNAGAFDAKKCGEVQAVGDTKDEFTFSSSSPQGLPVGYTLYSKDGSPFYLLKNLETSGEYEEVATYVPANQSITIASPVAVYAGGNFYNYLVVDAQTDSVFCLSWY